MSPLHSLYDGLRDESLRIAILVGLATVPFTVAFSLESTTDAVVTLGGSISGAAIVPAALLVGYYYNGRPTDARRAGIWTGLAASIGTVLVFGASSITAIASTSWPLMVVAAALTPVVVGFGVGLTVLVTTLVTMSTDWALARLHRDRQMVERDADRSGEDSRWWVAIPVYAVLTPMTLLYALWVQPESTVGVFLSVLLLISVVVLSIVVLVALFVDATEPRGPRTDWVPNVWLYVGGPVGVAALVYLVATARGMGYPPGYGQYGFLIALWIASVIYFVNQRRHRVLDGPAIGV